MKNKNLEDSMVKGIFILIFVILITNCTQTKGIRSGNKSDFSNKTLEILKSKFPDYNVNSKFIDKERKNTLKFSTSFQTASDDIGIFTIYITEYNRTFKHENESKNLKVSQINVLYSDISKPVIEIKASLSGPLFIETPYENFHIGKDFSISKIEYFKPNPVPKTIQLNEHKEGIVFTTNFDGHEHAYFQSFHLYVFEENQIKQLLNTKVLIGEEAGDVTKKNIELIALQTKFNEYFELGIKANTSNDDTNTPSGKQFKYEYTTIDKLYFLNGKYIKMSDYLADGTIYRVQSSSDLEENSRPQFFWSSFRAIDGSPETAWAEGNKDSGIKESVTVFFKKPEMIDIIELNNGCGIDKNLFFNNNRVKTLKLYFDNTFYKDLELLDSLDLQKYKIDSNKKAKSLKFEINDIYKGLKYNDTCLAEIFIYIK